MAHSKSEIKKAKNLLNKYAPKGEQLAYINSKEAKLLKSKGGAGKDVNVSGIKSYYYDAAGVEGATSGGSRDSSPGPSTDSGGGGGGADNSPQAQPRSILSRVGGFIRDAALTIATGGIFGLSKIGAIAAVKGGKKVAQYINYSGKVRKVVNGPYQGDSFALTNKDFGKKTNKTIVDNRGDGRDTPLAQNVGGRIVKLSPTTAEISQSSATDASPYDNRKTKAKGRSMMIMTSSRGINRNNTLTLGKPSLLGA